MDKKAFTLIELLIVVAIIGILAAIAVPNFLNAQVRAKVAVCKAEMKATEQALEMYRIDNNGVYMVRDSNLGGNDPSVFYHTYVWNHITTPIGYLTRYPLDPFYRESAWESRLPGGPSYQGVVVHTPDIDYLPYAASGRLQGHVPCSPPVAWLIVSVGPDGDLSVDPKKYSHLTGTAYFEFLFNVSNGLHSSGDLVDTSWLGLQF